VEKLRIRAEVYCGKGVPEEAQLLELGWVTEVVVSYLVCKRYGNRGCHVENNRGHGVISRRKLEEMKWYGCKEKREENAVHSQENRKVQQERGVVKRRSGGSSKC